MATYRVTRKGRHPESRPSPLDWPLLVEVVGWGIIAACTVFLLLVDWTLVGVTP